MDDESFEGLAKRMHSKSEAFGTEMEKIRTLNSDLKHKIEQLLSSLGALKGHVLIDTQDKKCAICYTRARTHAFVPCGHITCQSCSRRAAQRNRCFTCRQPVEATLRVYL